MPFDRPFVRPRPHSAYARSPILQIERWRASKLTCRAALDHPARGLQTRAAA